MAPLGAGYEGLKVPELRAALAERCLDRSGLKRDLVKRLEAHDAAAPPAADATPDTADPTQAMACVLTTPSNSLPSGGVVGEGCDGSAGDADKSAGVGEGDVQSSLSPAPAPTMPNANTEARVVVAADSVTHVGDQTVVFCNDMGEEVCDDVVSMSSLNATDGETDADTEPDMDLLSALQSAFAQAAADGTTTAATAVSSPSFLAPAPAAPLAASVASMPDATCEDRAAAAGPLEMMAEAPATEAPLAIPVTPAAAEPALPTPAPGAECAAAPVAIPVGSPSEEAPQAAQAPATVPSAAVPPAAGQDSSATPSSAEAAQVSMAEPPADLEGADFDGEEGSAAGEASGDADNPEDASGPIGSPGDDQDNEAEIGSTGGRRSANCWDVFPEDGMAPVVGPIDLDDSEAEDPAFARSRRARCLRSLLSKRETCKALRRTYRDIIAALRVKVDSVGGPRTAVSFKLKGSGMLSRAKSRPTPPATPAADDLATQRPTAAMAGESRDTMSNVPPADAYACPTAPLVLLRLYSARTAAAFVRKGHIVFEDDAVQYPADTLLPIRATGANNAPLLSLVSLWLLVAMRERYEAAASPRLCGIFGAARIEPQARAAELLDFILGKGEQCAGLLRPSELLSVPAPVPTRLKELATARRRPVERLAELRCFPGQSSEEKRSGGRPSKKRSEDRKRGEKKGKARKEKTASSSAASKERAGSSSSSSRTSRKRKRKESDADKGKSDKKRRAVSPRSDDEDAAKKDKKKRRERSKEDERVKRRKEREEKDRKKPSKRRREKSSDGKKRKKNRSASADSAPVSEKKAEKKSRKRSPSKAKKERSKAGEKALKIVAHLAEETEEAEKEKEKEPEEEEEEEEEAEESEDEANVEVDGEHEGQGDDAEGTQPGDGDAAEEEEEEEEEDTDDDAEEEEEEDGEEEADEDEKAAQPAAGVAAAEVPAAEVANEPGGRQQEEAAEAPEAAPALVGRTAEANPREEHAQEEGMAAARTEKEAPVGTIGTFEVPAGSSVGASVAAGGAEDVASKAITGVAQAEGSSSSSISSSTSSSEDEAADAEGRPAGSGEPATGIAATAEEADSDDEDSDEEDDTGETEEGDEVEDEGAAARAAASGATSSAARGGASALNLESDMMARVVAFTREREMEREAKKVQVQVSSNRPVQNPRVNGLGSSHPSDEDASTVAAMAACVRRVAQVGADVRQMRFEDQVLTQLQNELSLKLELTERDLSAAILEGHRRRAKYLEELDDLRAAVGCTGVASEGGGVRVLHDPIAWLLNSAAPFNGHWSIGSMSATAATAAPAQAAAGWL